LSLPGRIGRALEAHGALLQVALDYTRLGDAVRLALHLPRTGEVILEAGTPLIKSVGMEAVRVLRALPGSHAVAADTKTADTGALEVGLAAEAGADAATVLALAPRETILEALRAAEDAGLTLYADLIGAEDPVAAAERLRELGVHVALLHIGIDVQRRLGLTAGQVPGLVERVAGAFRGPVAVAGGVKPGEAGRLVVAGARIVIIGGAITGSPDPGGAARRALESIRGGLTA
jgi:3-hexulose-6-phosphate synthase